MSYSDKVNEMKRSC